MEAAAPAVLQVNLNDMGARNWGLYALGQPPATMDVVETLRHEALKGPGRGP